MANDTTFDEEINLYLRFFLKLLNPKNSLLMLQKRHSLLIFR